MQQRGEIDSRTKQRQWRLYSKDDNKVILGKFQSELDHVDNGVHRVCFIPLSLQSSNDSAHINSAY